MPSLENWQKKPLKIVEKFFENHKESDWKGEVLKYFETKFESSENISVVPSLNDHSVDELQPNSLVRFRCMIQDTFDNEFYSETYNLKDKENNKTLQKTSCFQDVIGCPNNCDIEMNLEVSKTGVRQVFYCVSIPAETEWVKETWKTSLIIKPNKETPSTSTASTKRARDEDDDNMVVDDSVGDKMQSNGDSETHKKIKQSSLSGKKSNAIQSLDKNHPLPGESGPVCLVKVYTEDAEFKVNEIMEFIGVLSVDPTLSSKYDSSAKGDDGLSSMDEGDMEETTVHHLPASLVPRLHVVAMKRLHHDNPLMPTINDTELRNAIQKEASSIRSSLLGLLEKAMLGDSLAAEYLLLHLIARVYTRRDMLALGKFSLNISGIPPNSTYPRILAQFLKDLVTKLHYLPMSIDKFNELRFIPTKNYSTERLDAGILQLPTGTHLVLDEGMLKPGTMDANGVKNIQALKNVMAFQKVDYNFQFHEASFECDINVLVLSEGKSLLPCDCQIELKPANGFPQNMEEYFTSFCGKCPVEFLNKSRTYISCTRLTDYELNEEMMKNIQEDFVNARKRDVNLVSADDLHARLILSRLLSVSVGQQGLSQQRYERVKALEAQRKERFSSQSSVSPNGRGDE